MDTVTPPAEFKVSRGLLFGGPIPRIESQESRRKRGGLSATRCSPGGVDSRSTVSRRDVTGLPERKDRHVRG